MAVSQTAQAHPALLGRALVAGIIGGAMVDLYLAVVMHTSLVAIWQFVASAVIGKIAFTTPSYAALGFVVHFAISIGWALIFAAAAQLRPALLADPWLWGFVFGVVVMAVMTLVLALSHLSSGAPSATALVNSLIDHTVFFGIPVAWWISRARET